MKTFFFPLDIFFSCWFFSLVDNFCSVIHFLVFRTYFFVLLFYPVFLYYCFYILIHIFLCLLLFSASVSAKNWQKHIIYFSQFGCVNEKNVQKKSASTAKKFRKIKLLVCKNHLSIWETKSERKKKKVPIKMG